MGCQQDQAATCSSCQELSTEICHERSENTRKVYIRCWKVTLCGADLTEGSFSEAGDLVGLKRIVEFVRASGMAVWGKWSVKKIKWASLVAFVKATGMDIWGSNHRRRWRRSRFHCSWKPEGKVHLGFFSWSLDEGWLPWGVPLYSWQACVSVTHIIMSQCSLVGGHLAGIDGNKMDSESILSIISVWLPEVLHSFWTASLFIYSCLLCIPSFPLKSFGQCKFSYKVSVLWNSLPISLCHSNSTSVFKSALKMHLVPFQ